MHRTLGTFPSVHDPATLALSVVVPAYNEEERMRIGLNEMVSFLTEKQAQDEYVTLTLWQPPPPSSCSLSIQNYQNIPLPFSPITNPTMYLIFQSPESSHGR